MKKYIAIAFLILVSLKTIIAQEGLKSADENPTADIHYIDIEKYPIIIDGEITDSEPWKYAEKHLIMNEIPLASTVKTESYWQMYYDYDNIYVLVKVKDNFLAYDITTFGSSWNNDCIELFFDMNRDKGEVGVYGEDDWQIRYIWSQDFYHGSHNGLSDYDDWQVFDSEIYRAQKTLLEDGSEAQEADYRNGEVDKYIIYEWEIPFAVLSEEFLPISGVAKFDFDVSSADDFDGNGRDGMNAWSSDQDAGYYDTRVFGTVNLIEEYVGIEDQIGEESIFFYPNPASSIIHFSANNSINQIELIDLSGRLVRSINGIDLRSLDVSGLKKGCYMLRVIDAGRKSRLEKILVL